MSSSPLSSSKRSRPPSLSLALQSVRGRWANARLNHGEGGRFHPESANFQGAASNQPRDRDSNTSSATNHNSPGPDQQAPVERHDAGLFAPQLSHHFLIPPPRENPISPGDRPAFRPCSSLKSPFKLPLPPQQVRVLGQARLDLINAPPRTRHLNIGRRRGLNKTGERSESLLTSRSQRRPVKAQGAPILEESPCFLR